MTAKRRADRSPQRTVTAPLNLRHVPPALDEGPAYPDDPLMGWTHEAEPPPELRVGTGAWPPVEGRGRRPT